AVLANLEAMRGRFAVTEELVVRSRDAVQRLGQWVWLLPIGFGFISLLRDLPAAAETELRAGYEALKKVGEKSHFSSVSALLAQAVYAQGRLDEAEQLVRESAAASRANDIHTQTAWRATHAKILAHRGLLADAEALAREAVAFVAKSDFH